MVSGWGGTADSVEDTQEPPSHPGSVVCCYWCGYLCAPPTVPANFVLCNCVQLCRERFTTDMHAGETQKVNTVMVIIVKQSLKGLKPP